jgi:hypothetical protein
MNKLICIILVFIPLIFFSSCQNKTVQLLSKKWDCVQADNIVPPGTKFQSPQDSADAVQLQSVVQSLNWTFKSNMSYECAVNSRVTVQGKYELLENDKILVCTPASYTGINRYVIKSLTENELILSGSAENASVVLHFKPH